MDVETLTPEQPVTAPAETPAEDSGSLADHESQFGPESKRQPPADEDAPAPKAPHRAQSHRATPNDVDDIAAQTKRLRQAEQDAGITAPDKKQGESDRAYNLRRQADVAEALRDARKAGSRPAQNAPPAALAPHQDTFSAPAARTLQPFGEPAPRPEAFQNADDPAEAYYRAIAAHEFRKQIWDAQQHLQAQHSEQSHREALAAAETRRLSLNAKISEYERTAPDFWQRLDEVEDLKFPDLMGEAIARDVDNAPRLMYHLATHPDDLVDAIGYAASFADDFSESSVALVRRRLSRYLSSVQGAGSQTPTGAPAPAPSVTVAPRPPTPVRTGPLKTGDEPPGDDDSLADHEKYFGRKRRR